MPIRVTVQTEKAQAEPAGLWNGVAVRGYRVSNKVGECPSWHAGERRLYWVDVRRQQLLRLDTHASEISRWELPEVVGALALLPSGQVWLGLRHRLVELDLESGRIEDVCDVESDRPSNRLNDGKVSPTGRWFVFGSMDDRPEKMPTGALYCVSANGHVARLYDGLVVSNGIAWSPDASVLYFSDSTRGLLMHAPWNEERGEMGVARVLAHLDEGQGRPDGAAVDAQGNYWSAGVSAACLNQLDAHGTLLRKLQLPCRAPTMAAFAGDGSRTVFVTSLVRSTWREIGPWDGALLELDMGVPGLVPPLLGQAL